MTSKNNISFEELFKSVFDFDNSSLSIRLLEVTGTGEAYPKCGVSKSHENLLKELIGLHPCGLPALRVIKVSNTCTSALCGTVRKSLENLINGSLELADDGLPALRISE